MSFVLTVVTGVMEDAHYDHSENITADGHWAVAIFEWADNYEDDCCQYLANCILMSNY